MGFFSARPKSLKNIRSEVEVLPLKPDVIGFEAFSPDERENSFFEAMYSTSYKHFGLLGIFRLSRTIKGELVDVNIPGECLGAVFGPSRDRRADEPRAVVEIPMIDTDDPAWIRPIVLHRTVVSLADMSYENLLSDDTYELCLHAAAKAIHMTANGTYDMESARLLQEIAPEEARH